MTRSFRGRRGEAFTLRSQDRNLKGPDRSGRFPREVRVICIMKLSFPMTPSRGLFFLFLKLNLEGCSHITLHAGPTVDHQLGLPGRPQGSSPIPPGGLHRLCLPLSLYSVTFVTEQEKTSPPFQEVGALGAQTMVRRQTDLSPHQERLRVPGELSSGEDSQCFPNTIYIHTHTEYINTQK